MSSIADSSNTSGEIFVRRKWSGQLVPIGASLSISFELMNWSTLSSSVKCPIIFVCEEQKPLNTGARAAAFFNRSSFASDSIFEPPKTGPFLP